jgi:hypothetical protein
MEAHIYELHTRTMAPWEGGDSAPWFKRTFIIGLYTGYGVGFNNFEVQQFLKN